MSHSTHLTIDLCSYRDLQLQLILYTYLSGYKIGGGGGGGGRRGGGAEGGGAEGGGGRVLSPE